MTMTRTAAMLGLSTLLLGCSLPSRTITSAELTHAGRYREAAELNLADARRSEHQQFWNSAVSYYLMAADNYRQSNMAEAELAALEDGRRAALQAWQQPEEDTERSPREGGALSRIEGRLAEYWLERDRNRAAKHYQAMLEHRDDVRMLYRAPGLELVKAASRSEALHSPGLTMRLYLFGLSGQYVEDGDYYPQLAIDFARRQGYGEDARRLRQRLANVRRLEPLPPGRDAGEQLRDAAERRARYASLGEATLAAVYADVEARLARSITGDAAPVNSTEVEKGLNQLAAHLAGAGKQRPARKPQPPLPAAPAPQAAAAVNTCIQIASGGPNTITLINNCSHNVSVAWCYIPAPGALQSEGTPIQGNQICIHNGTDFPQVVLASSGSTDLSRTYRSWELPYSQNTIYHLACNAGADGKALPRISGFDDVLRGSCPALEE